MEAKVTKCLSIRWGAYWITVLMNLPDIWLIISWIPNSQLFSFNYTTTVYTAAKYS